MRNQEGSTAAQLKRALRTDLRRQLAGMDPDQARRSAAWVCDLVLGLPELANARGVLTCLSFGDEIDTWGLVDRLRALGRPVYVPRADPRDGQLHVHPYPCELHTLSFGLKQPPRGAREIAADAIGETLDVVLVLGLGFDRDGYRLGHGRGYFDRFLAGRALPAIGLAYGFQLLDELPREAHDIPMTAVVTELGTCRPRRPRGTAEDLNR